MKSETIVGLFLLGALAVFLYLSMSIGSFRFDRDRYHFYKAYFDDTGGLESKDPVKIAGVDVGWVSEIKLPADGGKAMVIFRVKKDHKLAKNAHAMIRQEGFFGPKYLELDPGDSSTGILLPGSALGAPTQTPVSWGELINKFSDIATHFKSVASSLQTALGTREGEENLKLTLRSVAQASDRMAHFSDILERTLEKNETNVNATLADIRDITHSLKDTASKTETISTNIAQDLVPSLVNTSNEVGEQMVPAVTSLSQKAGSAFETIADATTRASDGIRGVGEVVEKINNGKGLLGKLINEEETYNDFRKTLRTFKEYSTKIHALDLIVDMHSENMTRDWDSKGYFEVKLRPTNDYFYVFQIVADQKGTIKRDVITTKRFDPNGNQLVAPDFEALYEYPARKDIISRRKNDILFGFQFGKRFNRLAVRAGVMENTFGVGVDFYVPLRTSKFHWITTFEIFDMKGVLRVDDTRPHMKWLNKVFFGKHGYTAFGIDDICSKGNQNFFIGGGVRFDDRDLKYLLPSLPIGVLTN